ncbi:MAG: heme-binding protein [Ahrensia sp.]|nr:heme-binding protein [Ahrensia sp.]
MKSIIRHEIAATTARDIVAAAVDYAAGKGWAVCAAICDPRGHMVSLARSDEVIAPAIQFAIDKAYTSGTLGKSTQAFFGRATARPALAMGLANRERILVFPGGIPIISAELCLGGLGVSGAQDEEDVECARTVLERFGFDVTE